MKFCHLFMAIYCMFKANFAAVSLIEKLRSRWQLPDLRSTLFVLLVFALTGTSVMFLKKLLQHSFFGDSRWFTYLYYWLIIPFYNLLLLFFGWCFGQFDFFWQFEKKLFSRLKRLFINNK